MFQSSVIQPARATKIGASQRSLHNDISTKQSSRIPLKDGNSQNNVEGSKVRSILSSKETLKPAIIRTATPSNPLFCEEYSTEIKIYLRSAEEELWSSNQIFENQTNLTPKMRATLIDWLVDVQKRKKLHTDTLFYAVHYIDRYLMERDIDKSKFQLLGSAALLIASKTEEIYPISCESLVHLAGKSFSVNALCRMESSLFTTIDYNTTPIVASHFLKRYLLKAGGSSKFTLFAYYVNETLLLDSDFIEYKPSMTAAAVILFAMAIINDAPELTPELQDEMQYSFAELRPLISKVHLSVLSSATSRFQAIRKKYATADNEYVSAIEIPKNLRI